MAEDVIAGTVSYPLLPGLISANYVCSHGISPGCVILRTQEGRDIPRGLGDCIIGDGFRRLVLKNCRLDQFTIDRIGGSGTEWLIRLTDERWKWEYTTVTGWYNQLDPHGKLIPSTVRSPTELALICLKAMGVTKYAIDMPPGITSQDAAVMPDLLVSGINFPAIGINPPCDWYGDNAATVLAGLCDACGRRLVYDPIARSVQIIRAGIGAALPRGSVSMQQLTITSPETPDAVVILGSPTRYQGLFPLQAVGIDWDGQIKPIQYLSYAPLGDPAKHKVAVTITSVTADSLGNLPALRIEVAEVDPNGAVDGAMISTSAEYQVMPGDTIATAAAGLTAALNAALAAAGRAGTFTVTGTATGLTVEHNLPNRAFEVYISGTSSAWMVANVVQSASSGEPSWKYCSPPLFEGVRATSQLSLEAARALAQKSVFKMYRLTGTDVTTGKAPMFVPGYGPVKKRQYIDLQDGQVEQVVPEAGDANFIDVNEQSLVQNLYDGYSRDKLGQVYGSVAVEVFEYTYVGDGFLAGADVLADNTRANELVPVDFSVDKLNQSIVFGSYVYRLGPNGTIEEPKSLVLKIACCVRDEDTQQLHGYTDMRVIRPGTNLQVVRRPDVQLNVYGTYKYGEATGWKLDETRILETDAIVRARYYLDAAMIQLQLKPGEIRRYNGIMPIRMDGRIMQVSYDIRGGVGCETTVSLNAEHDVWTLPFPARRRAEALAAVDRVVPPGARNIQKEGAQYFRATSG